MPQKAKKTRVAPENYWDMEGSVEKDKRVKMSEVFGKAAPTRPNKKTGKKVPTGSHQMPDGTVMKDKDMKKKKTKKKSGY